MRGSCKLFGIGIYTKLSTIKIRTIISPHLCFYCLLLTQWILKLYYELKTLLSHSCIVRFLSVPRFNNRSGRKAKLLPVTQPHICIQTFVLLHQSISNVILVNVVLCNPAACFGWHTSAGRPIENTNSLRISSFHFYLSCGVKWLDMKNKKFC